MSFSVSGAFALFTFQSCFVRAFTCTFNLDVQLSVLCSSNLSANSPCVGNVVSEKFLSEWGVSQPFGRSAML